jgi:hypothetical protein
VESDTDLLVVPIEADGTSYLSFAPGISGWAIFVSPEYPPSDRYVFVRFGRSGAGKLPKIRPYEAYLCFPDGLDNRRFDDLPIAQLEAAVNQPAYYGEILTRLPSANMVAMPFPWHGSVDWWLAKLPALPPKRRRPRLKLEIPSGSPKPDKFYRQVADRFAYLATVSKRPATDLAAANDVPATTVHRWVKEARRRGLLPPGERKRDGDR